MYDFTQPGPLAQPPEPKKSILDGVLEHLYPSGAFGGLLPPELLHEERMMALRHAGLSLMASAGPRSGYDEPRSFGADLATALDPHDWQQQLGQTAQTALSIHGAQRKLYEEAAADELLKQFPPVPGETPEQLEKRLRAMGATALNKGMPELAQTIFGMIDKTRPEPLKESNGYLVDPRSGQPVAKLPPKVAQIDAQQVWTSGVGQLLPWDKVKSTVERYGLYRDAPATPASNQALVAAAGELLNTHGGYPDERSAMDHIPLIGELIKLLRELGGKTNLRPEERDDLIQTTDKVVGQIAEDYGRKRKDVERLMGGTSTNPLFPADQIPDLLPATITWPKFTPGAKTVRPKVKSGREGMPY